MSLPARKYANVAVIAPRPAKAGKVQKVVERDSLREAELRLKRKVEQTNRVLDALEAKQARLGAHIAELQKRKKAACARAERIEDRTLRYMAEHKAESLTGIRVTLTARPAPVSVVIADESLIPNEYMREKLTSTPDKVGIKRAMEAGEDVPGCGLAQKVSLIRK